MTLPRLRVDVDLDAVRDNVRRAGELVGEAEVMAVVKADGYGHGAHRIARTALDSGAACLGVAFVEEGLRLRESIRDEPVVVLTDPLPGEEPDAVAHGLTPTVSGEDSVRRVAAAADRLGRDTAVHLKIDTGLHRLGADPDEAGRVAALAVELGLRVEGVWTHFATADDPHSSFADTQLDRFHRALDDLRALGVRPRYRHAAGSAAAMARPAARLDLVRLGAVLYGIRPGPAVPHLDGFRPALSWRSTVVAIRRADKGERVGYGLKYRLETATTLAVVPVGFADGLPRLLGNRGQVIVGGGRRRIAGAVAMSHVVIDCADDPVAVGDEVVLLGAGQGTEISAEEFAQWSGSSVYETVTRISSTVPRRYLGTSREDAKGETDGPVR
ncbi:alanine racemase [Streptomyces sp. NPDC050704]|uniref:alanine racemase n=1 Tax=Streptomyces sp. NPDC050704 TaxID=3157219 RepID=UPI003434E73C